MKHYIGPQRYSTQSHSTYAHENNIGNPSGSIISAANTFVGIKQQHDEAIKKQQEQEKHMNDRFDRELDRFAMQKIAEDDRRAKDDAIREERNRRAYEEWDRMDATQREMDFDDQFRYMEEDQRISSILTREANRDRDIDARISRNDDASINAYMRQMDSYKKRMSRNEDEIATQAEYFDTQLDKFAISQINSNRPGSTKPSLSQIEKDAISALQNYGYSKSEASSMVSAVYSDGMSIQDVVKAALRR